MKRKILRELITNNSYLEFGFYNDLFNLSQLAKFLQPLLTARIGEEVSLSSIKMGLSRWRKELDKTAPKTNDYAIDNISIHSGLFTYTFNHTPEIDRELMGIYSKIKSENGYITLTHGVKEVTVIADEEYRCLLNKMVSTEPKLPVDDVAAICVNFGERYRGIPGIVYAIVQQLTLQHLNVIELSSTATELTLYLAQKDIQLAFDTLYVQFLQRG